MQVQNSHPKPRHFRMKSFARTSPRGSFEPRGIWILAILSSLCFLGRGDLLLAQDQAKDAKSEAAGPEILVIRGAKAHLEPGKAPKVVDLLIENGVVKSIGTTIEAPKDSTVVEASGKVLVPSFIDAGHSALVDTGSLSVASAGSADFTSEMLTVGNPRAREQLQAAGIGLVYADIPVRPGLKGPTGSLVVTDPDEITPKVLESMAGVTFSISGKTQRGETNAQIRRTSRGAISSALDAAKRYRESWKKYEKELEEHQKKLSEWEEKAKKSGGSEEKSPKAASTESGGASEDDKNSSREKQRESLRDRLARRRSERSASTTPTATEDAAKSKDERPKAPTAPQKEPSNEVLLRVIDRKAVLRVEAHWKEDILAVCELAKNRNVRLVLLGASEAMEATAALKEIEAVVVVSAPESYARETLERIGARPDLPAQLTKAGIKVAFATAQASNFRHDSLGLLAALSISKGLSNEDALKALTVHAADAVGASDRYGTIAEGRLANFMLLSGEPLEPATRVEKIIMEGRVKTPRGERMW